IGIEARWVCRSWSGSILLALVIAALIGWPGTARAQLLFSADFNANAVGALPTANVGSITLDNLQGGDSILVQGPADGFVNNSALISHPQGFGNAPALVAHPVPGSYTGGFYIVSWRASSRSVNSLGQASVVSPGGASAFTVRH